MTRTADSSPRPVGSMLVILLGLLAGLDLRHSKSLVPEAMRVGCARGLAQLFSSGVSAAGVACFILLHQEHAVWSWSLYLVCSALILVFDSSFNLVLNLLAGWRYASLLAIRIVLTVVLGYFTANTLTLLGNQRSVIPMAEQLAGEVFDKRIQPDIARVVAAEAAWLAGQTALTNYENTQASVITADTPSACDGFALALSDDPLQRRAQLRAQNMKLKACDQSLTALQASRAQLASAQTALRGELQVAVTDAKTGLDAARASLKVEQDKKPTTVAALAGNIGFQLAAIGRLNAQDSQAKLMYWGLIGFIFGVEFLALLFKIYTAGMDQAALRQREELIDACVAHSIGITAAEFMHQVGRQAKRSDVRVAQARDIYSADVKSSMDAKTATRRTKSTYEKLVADLAKETVEHGENAA